MKPFNKQMVAWIDKLVAANEKQLATTEQSLEDKLAFVQHQYNLLDVTERVMTGDAKLIGSPQRNKSKKDL